MTVKFLIFKFKIFMVKKYNFHKDKIKSNQIVLNDGENLSPKEIIKLYLKVALMKFLFTSEMFNRIHFGRLRLRLQY